jgi:hypothetical protein
MGEIGRRRGLEMAGVVDRDALERRFAAAGLVQVEQHPPGLALAAARSPSRQARSAASAASNWPLAYRMALPRPPARWTAPMAVSGMPSSTSRSAVFRSSRGSRRRRWPPAGARRLPAQPSVVEDVGRHLQLDLVDLGGGGARDLALALALGLGIERHAGGRRERAGGIRQVGASRWRARACAGPRLGRIVLFLQEGKESHVGPCRSRFHRSRQ